MEHEKVILGNPDQENLEREGPPAENNEKQRCQPTTSTSLLLQRGKLSSFLSFTVRKKTRERKKDWVGTPVYFPPIYIETGYYFNPVQETLKHDCIIKKTFHGLLNKYQGHGLKLHVTRKGQNPSVFSSGQLLASVASNILCRSVSCLRKLLLQIMAAVRNNIIKECSVGLKLGDALCFSDKFVSKDSSLITLDDSDLSKTIGYRVNMTNIQTICLHHVAAFSSHFIDNTNPPIVMIHLEDTNVTQTRNASIVVLRRRRYSKQTKWF